MNCLNNPRMLSFECPKVDEDSTLRMFSLDFALVFTSVTWDLKVSPLPRVTPRTLVVGLTGMGEPKSVTLGSNPYSRFQGVTKVNDDFGADTCILLEVNQVYNRCRYCCNCVAAVEIMGCWEVMVRSSA